MTPMLRAFAGLLTASAVLAGCSSNPSQTALTKQLLNRSAATQPDATFVAHQNAGAPAYVAGLQDKPGAYTLFVRQTANAKGEETWISPDHLSLGMKDGMLIATRGLGNDQLSADARQTRTALTSGQNAITEHFVTLLAEGSTAKTLAFRCQVTRERQEPVQLSKNYTADTDLFSEACTNGQVEFRNLYWVERGSRNIVQSRQWISEATGELALRVMLP